MIPHASVWILDVASLHKTAMRGSEKNIRAGCIVEVHKVDVEAFRCKGGVREEGLHEDVFTGQVNDGGPQA